MKGRIPNILLVWALVALPIVAYVGWGAEGHWAEAARTLTVDRTLVTGQDFESSPVMFIENAGQWDDGARFQYWGGAAGTMWLAEDAIWLTVLEPTENDDRDSSSAAADTLSGRSSALREDLPPIKGVNIKLSFVGANPHPRIETFNRLDTTVSYFLGNDPDHWWGDVSVWGGVRYEDLYPGVDLEFASESGQLTQRWIVKEGADVSAVRLQVEGVTTDGAQGHPQQLLDAAGFSLVITGAADTGQCPICLSEPNWATNGNALLPALNTSGPAGVSAQLAYSTYLGGSNDDEGRSIAVDQAGAAYVTGSTASTDFPVTPGAFSSINQGGYRDSFVVKLNANGSGLIYGTFFGGTGSELARSIAVDGLGNAYVTGGTTSADFPTTPNAFDRTYGGSFDTFSIKLNSAGSGLVYATFLGGSSSDPGYAIAVDATGNAYLTGYTLSTDFPTTPNAFDRSYNGGTCTFGPCPDAYVAKLNPTGSGLAFATYLGGNSYEEGSAIVVDAAGNSYLTGRTDSGNFPVTAGAFDTSFNGITDAFVVKLNPVGSNLVFGSFLGGYGLEEGYAIAVDGMARTYVTGRASSTDFPTTPGAFDRSYNSGQDAFVVKFNQNGSGLVYSTFLGGRDWDTGSGIALDTAGNSYVTGGTRSNNFPTTPDAIDRSYGGGWDVFAAKLNSTGSGLTYSTYLGGPGEDYSQTIAIDGVGRVFLSGYTNSASFPTTPGTLDPSYNGGNDAFVAQILLAALPTPTPTPTPTATPTATPTLTPTPTPTATPVGPWASWRDGNALLLVPPHGAEVALDYGNMTPPVLLEAQISGAALFSTGAISPTTSISTTLATGSGSWSIRVIPDISATVGSTFTIQTTVGGIHLVKSGRISSGGYLPLILHGW